MAPQRTNKKTKQARAASAAAHVSNPAPPAPATDGNDSGDEFFMSAAPSRRKNKIPRETGQAREASEVPNDTPAPTEEQADDINPDNGFFASAAADEFQTPKRQRGKGRKSNKLRALQSIVEEKEKEPPRPKPLTLQDLRAIVAYSAGFHSKTIAVRVTRVKSKHPLERKNSVLAVKAVTHRSARQIEKGFVKDSDRIRERNAERRAQTSMSWNPFIVNIIDTFSDPKNMYQLQEHAVCGKLSDLIALKGPLPTNFCQFYLANLVKGLEYIHSWGIIHRNIQTRTLYIGGNGYLMIGDFDHSAHLDEFASWTAVGTSMYSAPECNYEGNLASHLFDNYIPKRIATDWWSAAIVLYEMATDNLVKYRYVAPDEPEYATFFKGLREGKPEWPTNIPIDQNLKHLVESMTQPDLESRFGSTLYEMKDRELYNQDIRKHNLMCNFPWDDAAKRLLISPWLPTPYPDRLADRLWKPELAPALKLVQAEIPHLQIDSPPARRHVWEDGNDASDSEEDYSHLLPQD